MASEIAVIVPVFNRPAELAELLDSLVVQTWKGFEVIVVDDGSMERSEEVVNRYRDKLSIRYFYKENSGPGQSRNYGCKKTVADFFVFFDSDCVAPEGYMESLKSHIPDIDAFGGPDRAHPAFTDVQKAISYAMTSLFTTGGIRGGSKSAEKFHPRSFNMGFSRRVYERTSGFSTMRFGEDIDLSIRIFGEGFRVKLIPECYVYHKRRTDFKKFFKQVFNSGIARINLYKRHPKSMKPVHFFPATFTVYQLLSVSHALYHRVWWPVVPTIIYLLLIFIDASLKFKSLRTGALSAVAAVVQLIGYGLGFIKGFIRRIILGKPEFHAFRKTFYD